MCIYFCPKSEGANTPPLGPPDPLLPVPTALLLVIIMTLWQKANLQIAMPGIFPQMEQRINFIPFNNIFFSFLFILELNLSYNKMSTLPEEVSSCSQLETVDISHNSFISLPNCLLNLPKIIKINAKKNFIAGMYKEKTQLSYTVE